MKKANITILLFVIIIIGVGIFCLYQYTELFGKKILPVKIDSIEIQYIPGYDIGIGEMFNTEEQTVIDVQTIDLKENDIKKIKKDFNNIKKSTENNDELYNVRYKLIINKNIVMKIGDGIGDIQKNDNYTPVIIPRSFIDSIETIIEQNNNNVLKTITSNNIVAKLEGASITIKSKENLKSINESLVYYPIYITDDYKTYDGGYKISLILDNNINIYLYNDKIGFISQKDGDSDSSTYAVFTDGLYDLIYQIYNVSIN